MLGEIQGWLSACDLVKFAKISPTAAEARGALESAIRIVTATAARAVAPVAAPRAAAGGGAPCLTRATAAARPAQRARAARSPTRSSRRCSCRSAAAYAVVAAQRRRLPVRAPGALALIPLAVALVLWAGSARRRRGAALLRYSRAAELGAQRPGLVARLRDLPTVLRLAAVVLVGVALARPQTTRASDDLELEGIDIVIALDCRARCRRRIWCPTGWTRPRW